MDEQPAEKKWYQFSVKRKHIEVAGGLCPVFGVTAAVGVSPFYYGIVKFDFLLGPLFLTGD